MGIMHDDPSGVKLSTDKPLSVIRRPPVECVGMYADSGRMVPLDRGIAHAGGAVGQWDHDGLCIHTLLDTDPQADICGGEA